MISRTSHVYLETAACIPELLRGVVLSVDPSCGSTSSMPGFAVLRGGVEIDSGIIEIPLHLPLHKRLRRLANGIRGLYRKYDPDVLVYEEIPAQRHGGGSAGSHASLLKAVGAILSVPGPEHYVGIMPISWKKLVRDSYVKGDREDACEMLYIVHQLAEQIQEIRSKKK